MGARAQQPASPSELGCEGGIEVLGERAGVICLGRTQL